MELVIHWSDDIKEREKKWIQGYLDADFEKEEECSCSRIEITVRWSSEHAEALQSHWSGKFTCQCEKTDGRREFIAKLVEPND